MAAPPIPPTRSEGASASDRPSQAHTVDVDQRIGAGWRLPCERFSVAAMAAEAPVAIQQRRGGRDPGCGKRDIVGRMAQAFPLAMAPQGQPVTVKSVTAGRMLEARLLAMGLTVGTRVTVLQREASGPLLLALGETRLGIGAGMAMKIMVTPAESGQT